MMKRGTPKQIDFTRRIMVRLRDWGYSYREIGDWFGVSRSRISKVCGVPSLSFDKEREFMRGRVMSRLVAAPHRFKLREVGSVWGISIPLCSRLINDVRYGERCA